MASTLLSRVKGTIRRHCLLQIGDRVLIACSGGPDSAALLNLLYGIKDNYQIQLYLAHINHGLRGSDSEKDETFVKSLGRVFDLPVFVKKIGVKKLSQREKLSIEEAARMARYEFFEALADRLKIDKIATGHTQNDQAETVLMRLLRGAGPAGLSGIPIKRGRIIRPLLKVPRKDILKYLKVNRIRFRVDKTNLKSHYLRNKVRNRLLPQLSKEYNPNLVAVLSRTAENLSESQSFINQQIELQTGRILSRQDKNSIILNLPKLRRLSLVLQKGMIRSAWQKLSGELYPLDFDEVDRVLRLAISGKAGQRVNLKKNYWAEKSRASLIFMQKEPKLNKLRIPLKKEIRLDKLHLKIKSEIFNRSDLPDKISTRNEREAYLDLDKFTLPPVLRGWKNGEKFKPLGMEGSKKLSDFFTDLKVPRYLRENVPVLSSNGRIAWVVGYRISEDFKVIPQTKRVLHLQAEAKGFKNYSSSA
jgi:tRNA(Ile)-lysidine synthase